MRHGHVVGLVQHESFVLRVTNISLVPSKGLTLCVRGCVRVLQRTAISTNIKERLDFSCALFGPDGGLVANAPHIPVHLGAMQETVQYQVSRCSCDGPMTS